MFIYLFDPLEQFDVLSVLPIFLNFLPTNLNVIFFFNFVLFCCLIKESQISYSKSSNRYNIGYFNVFFWSFKKIFELILEISTENIAVKKKSFVIIIFFLFNTLLLNNLVGMIPFSYTVTSSLIFTFFIATGFFIGLNLIGFYHNRSSIFRTFLPGGSPILIAPLLILIEIISYLSRIFSLSIRLFANMMSGHALLKILIGFSWVAFMSNAHFFNIVAILPWLVVSAAFILEFAIAGLQAYVFTVLICIYINDAINPH